MYDLGFLCKYFAFSFIVCFLYKKAQVLYNVLKYLYFFQLSYKINP